MNTNKKIIAFLCVNLFMTIIYLFIPDKDFGGINKLQEAINNELLERHAEKKLDGENYINNNKITHQIDEYNMIHRIFNRFYFSVVTGTTLGFGDIYPNTILTKSLVIFHLFVIFYIFIC
tara:strand:+ start:465 stop:824 length:360 start_codon:yes stop_codon:yes gene_type:complete